ncbi:hypothetical protein GJV07_23280 [Enterobacteriaceae bacterium RIT711]|nr:hypothetical protein [Enterobacteriaceae bacterium RIT711]
MLLLIVGHVNLRERITLFGNLFRAALTVLMTDRYVMQVKYKNDNERDMMKRHTRVMTEIISDGITSPGFRILIKEKPRDAGLS